MSGQAADLPAIWDALADAIDVESREAESLDDKPHWARLRGRVSQARYCAAQLRAALTAQQPQPATDSPGRPTTSLEDTLLANVDRLNDAEAEEWQERYEEEKLMRLHLAGERDEARSDLARMGRLAEEILGAFKGSPARVAVWRGQAERITSRHHVAQGPHEAPGAAQ